MRSYYKYIPKKQNINTQDRFKFTDELLINLKDINDRFVFDKFKNYELNYKIYNYLKKKLNKKSTFFIASSWGWVEHFLSKTIPLTASDVNEEYVNFHKNNKSLKYIKFDILDISERKEFYNNFEQVVMNNVEYLFDRDQMQKCLQNIYKITHKEADVFIIFRSKDSFIIKIIDFILLPIENKIKTIFKNFQKDKWYFTKNHMGFKRSEKEFIQTFKKNNFQVISIYKDMFEAEYSKLSTVRILRISKLLSMFFFKSHPYLNIVHLRKII